MNDPSIELGVAFGKFCAGRLFEVAGLKRGLGHKAFRKGLFRFQAIAFMTADAVQH
mgnify:CR=1 FL=1